MQFDKGPSEKKFVIGSFPIGSDDQEEDELYINSEKDRQRRKSYVMVTVSKTHDLLFIFFLSFMQLTDDTRTKAENILYRKIMRRDNVHLRSM